MMYDYYRVKYRINYDKNFTLSEIQPSDIRAVIKKLVISDNNTQPELYFVVNSSKPHIVATVVDNEPACVVSLKTNDDTRNDIR